jgi:Ca2+-binding RTX toxin-like protein
MATITGTAGNDTIDNSGESPASSDLYDLMDGNDVVRAGGGNDTMFGGLGSDSLRGDGGNDSILGEDGNDTLLGDAGNDQLFGGDGLDRLEGGAGSDLLFGGAGNDNLFGGSDKDTLAGGAGADLINGGAGLDFVDYSASGGAVTIVLDGGVYTGGDATGDTLTGIDGIIGSSFSDNLTGFDGQVTTGSDIYTNIFFGGGGNDTLDGRGGNDELYGGADNDSIIGGAGDDRVSGDDGNDTVSGGTGNDTVEGGAGRDELFGGTGNDTVDGGADNDTLEGGTGNDRLFGGIGNDRIIIRDGDVTTVAGGDVDTVPGYEFVFGGGGGVNAPDDFDTLDLTAYGPSRVQIVRNSNDPTNDEYENGFVRILDDNGNEVGRVEFTNIERIVPCFTPGTLIRTDRGDVAVEDLMAGDQVLTRDHGLQPLRWVGRRQLSGPDLMCNPDLQPIRIARGALGDRQPNRSMLVSPQHRVLLAGAGVELLFGEVEVLVPAKHLVGKVEATSAMPAEGVTYIHILFDRHEVVLSDGLWTESFQPAERTVSAMDAAVRDEVLALFPELAETDACQMGARLSLKSHEAKVLLSLGSGHAPR